MCIGRGATTEAIIMRLRSWVPHVQANKHLLHAKKSQMTAAFQALATNRDFDKTMSFVRSVSLQLRMTVIVSKTPAACHSPRLRKAIQFSVRILGAQRGWIP